MLKQVFTAILFISTLQLLACTETDSDSDEIIPVRRVERAPNELVYVDKEFTPEENKALIEVLKMENMKYYTDNNGNVYISARTSFGESKETFFWILTEEVYSHLARQQKQTDLDTTKH